MEGFSTEISFFLFLLIKYHTNKEIIPIIIIIIKITTTQEIADFTVAFTITPDKSELGFISKAT